MHKKIGAGNLYWGAVLQMVSFIVATSSLRFLFRLLFRTALLPNVRQEKLWRMLGTFYECEDERPSVDIVATKTVRSLLVPFPRKVKAICAMGRPRLVRSAEGRAVLKDRQRQWALSFENWKARREDNGGPLKVFGKQKPKDKGGTIRRLRLRSTKYRNNAGPIQRFDRLPSPQSCRQTVTTMSL